MKILMRIVMASLLFTNTQLFADGFGGGAFGGVGTAPMQVSEEDGDPSGFPINLVFPNTTLSQDASSTTYTVSFSSSALQPGSTNYVQVNPASTQSGGFEIQTGTTTGQMWAGEFIETTGSSALTGTFSLAISSKTSDFTADGNTSIYFCDALSSSITVTLPDATEVSRRIYWFIKVDTTTNEVGLYPQSGQEVGFSSNFNLSSQGESLGIVSNGHNWFGF